MWRFDYTFTPFPEGADPALGEPEAAETSAEVETVSAGAPLAEVDAELPAGACGVQLGGESVDGGVRAYVAVPASAGVEAGV